MRRIPPVTDKQWKYSKAPNMLIAMILSDKAADKCLCIWQAGYGVRKDEGRKLAIVFAQTYSPWYI